MFKTAVDGRDWGYAPGGIMSRVQSDNMFSELQYSLALLSNLDDASQIVCCVFVCRPKLENVGWMATVASLAD